MWVKATSQKKRDGKIRKAEATGDAWCLRALWFKEEVCWAIWG